MKKLSNDDMKRVVGGLSQHNNCTVTNNADCGGGTSSYYCNGSLDDCQSAEIHFVPTATVAMIWIVNPSLHELNPGSFRFPGSFYFINH